MDPVDHEHGGVEHANPHDHVRLPAAAGHVADEALHPQVVRLIVSREQGPAALPIDREQLPNGLVARANVPHEAGEQGGRLGEFPGG